MALPADGYQALLSGLARAREMEGEPWAEELVSHWEAAVERFAQRWREPSGCGRG